MTLAMTTPEEILRPEIEWFRDRAERGVTQHFVVAPRGKDVIQATIEWLMSAWALCLTAFPRASERWFLDIFDDPRINGETPLYLPFHMRLEPGSLSAVVRSRQNWGDKTYHFIPKAKRHSNEVFLFTTVSDFDYRTASHALVWGNGFVTTEMLKDMKLPTADVGYGPFPYVPEHMMKPIRMLRNR